ncbi:thioredoxin family protein [Bacillaceae bacterium C204]|uniref:thioredoxin family protein n=1 Tax=Neobacillus sp. 204 TaxID=3383351 RepID=UPI00397C1D07
MNEWNRNKLSAFLDGKATGLVYFYTPMCGTCQVASKMLQVIEELVELNIGKMNLNFYPDLAREFEIESVPCLVFVKSGEVIETLYAFHSVPFLLEKIKQHLL